VESEQLYIYVCFTDRHYITKTLLKVALNIIALTYIQNVYVLRVSISPLFTQFFFKGYG